MRNEHIDEIRDITDMWIALAERMDMMGVLADIRKIPPHLDTLESEIDGLHRFNDWLIAIAMSEYRPTPDEVEKMRVYYGAESLTGGKHGDKAI